MDRVLEDTVGNAGQDTHPGKGQDHVECDPDGLGERIRMDLREGGGMDRKGN
jgi:hypothetical protein